MALLRLYRKGILYFQIWLAAGRNVGQMAKFCLSFALRFDIMSNIVGNAVVIFVQLA